MNEGGGNVISAQITANVSGLIAGLKDASAATATHAAVMRDNLVEVSHGAHEAGAGVAEFTHHMSEMRTEMRLSNFMAGQIAAMGIASKGAAAEVTGLVSAFAIGGGLGLAIDGVKLLVTEILKGDEEIKKFSDDAVKSLKALQDQVDGYLASMRGATEAEKLQHASIGPLLRQEGDLKQELIKLNIKAADVQQEADEAQKKGRTTALQLALNERDSLFDEINKKQKLLEITREQIKAATETIKPLAAAEDTKKAQEEADKQQQIDDALYAHKIKLMEDHYKQRQRLLEQIDKAEGDSAKAIEEFNRHLTEEWFKEEKRREKAADEAAAATQASIDTMAAQFDRVGKQIGSALLSMITDSKHAGQAAIHLVMSFANDLLGVLIEMAARAAAEMIVGAAAAKLASVGTTQGHIAEAVAGAAASVAFVPFVGPGLAAGEAASMLGMLEGITAPLLSFGGGGDVPADGLAYLHRKEMVMDPVMADDIRESLAGGGGGGGGTHLHMHVGAGSIVDGEWWDRHEGNIVRKIQDATRKGRLPR